MLDPHYILLLFWELEENDQRVIFLDLFEGNLLVFDLHNILVILLGVRGKCEMFLNLFKGNLLVEKPLAMLQLWQRQLQPLI